jgi:threonine dehydrogenase-like Zn-dependent dehydrogenase
VVDFRSAAGVTPGAQSFELFVSDPFAVVGAGITAAVPEPETFALMLLGLGALGLRARQAAARRNDGAAQPTGAPA